MDEKKGGYSRKVRQYMVWPLIIGFAGLSLFAMPKDTKAEQTKVNGEYASRANATVDNVIWNTQAGISNTVPDKDCNHLAMKHSKDEEYQEVINTSESNNPEFFYQLGKAYLKEGIAEKAVEYHQKCLKEGGDKAMMYFSYAESILLAAEKTGYLSITLEAIEPYQKYLDKGGTTPERDEYVRNKLKEISEYKTSKLREYQKKEHVD